ncbi:MAG TPA: MarR family transcriptional regulator [Acidimicrobiales bacterium]|nr:MarR family transcriptional regulator [Acidimicrobiales bacterium]
MTPPTPDTTERPAPAPVARVSAGLERSLTQVGRAILRLEVPSDALPDGVAINRTGHWLLVMVSESAPVRLSEIADSVELDLSTVSRQVRDLVTAGLLAKVPDPADGRAALLSLTERGAAVLEAVSEARRRVLAEAIADWTDEERTALADGLFRLGAGLQHARDDDERNR